MPEDQGNIAEMAPAGAEDAPRSRYPAEAFEIVSEGLSYAIRKIHGPETPVHQLLARFIAAHDIDWAELGRLAEDGRLPEPVREAVAAAGGPDKLNRHITGRELCWGFREFALKRWGLLAHTVLSRWNVRESIDIGRIVFETIERGQMQKQPGDSLEDFEDVFDFNEAFDEVYRLDPEEPSDSSDDELG